MQPADGKLSVPRKAFAIIPAAGESVRMGQPKLLLPWNNSTVIETVLQAWRAGGVDKIVVTTRPGDDGLAEICRRHHADVVVPKVAPLDMKASVAAALNHLAETYHPTASDVWLVAPADLPLLSSGVIRAILAAHSQAAESAGSDCIFVPTHAGRRGHPVLLPWTMWEQVTRLGPIEGLNAILRRAAVREVAVDSPVSGDDLDTPADVARLQNRHNRAE